jgi:hypothetical protein
MSVDLGAAREILICLQLSGSAPEFRKAENSTILHESNCGSFYSDFDRPKKKPRRGPNCGAPTPTPVPLRIS